MIKRFKRYGRNFIRAPGFPDVLVEAYHGNWNSRYTGEVFVIFIGLQDDLIAGGFATPEMLVPYGKKGAPRRTDANGHRFNVDRYFVTRDGMPVRRYRLRRQLPVSFATRLIGVPEALADRESRDRELENLRAFPEQIAIGEPSTTPQPRTIPISPSRRRAPAPYLRLIVDNTRAG